MTILQFLVTAIGGASVALLVAGVLGKRLIDHRLTLALEQHKSRMTAASSAELEQLRAHNARELEEGRHRLNTLLRQTSKLHDKEFEVLSEAWGKLNEALGHIANLVSRWTQNPDLKRMDRARFEAFVAGCRFEAVDKQELLRSSTPNEYYQERITWYRIEDARKASRDFYRAIQLNSIFIEPSVRTRLLAIDNLLRTILISREVGHEAADRKLWAEASEQLDKEVMPLKQEIEALVQRRLGYDVPSEKSG
jgi:hypothetical protein